MKINLKVRARNPVFWLTAVPAFLAFVYSVLSLFDVVPSISEQSAVNVVTAIVSMLTTIGVLVDPTTKGVKDSKMALSYCKPGECGEKAKENPDADENCDCVNEAIVENKNIESDELSRNEADNPENVRSDFNDNEPDELKIGEEKTEINSVESGGRNNSGSAENVPVGGADNVSGNTDN